MTPWFYAHQVGIPWCFTSLWVPESRAQLSFFTPSVGFGLLRQLTELHMEVRISRQVVPPHVGVHIGQQASVQSFLLFVHDTGRNEIIQSLPKSIYTLRSCPCNPGCFFSCLHFAKKFPLPMYNFQIKNLFLCTNSEHHRNRESF